MLLQLVSRPDFFVEEHQILAMLFENGLNVLHLKKSVSEPVYSERLLKLISPSYHSRITVHQLFYLKEEFALQGICLDASASLPEGYMGEVGRTCHSLKEVSLVKETCNSVILSDVLSMPSRELEKASASGLIDQKVMALCPPDIEQVRQIAVYGFGGIVIDSSFWSRFNLQEVSDYQEILTLFRALQHTVA